MCMGSGFQEPSRKFLPGSIPARVWVKVFPNKVEIFDSEYSRARRGCSHFHFGNLLATMQPARVWVKGTDSRTIAQAFEKAHKHVLDAIDKLVAENSATKKMFYEASREYREQNFRYYLMNRDGFSLLVMGCPLNKKAVAAQAASNGRIFLLGPY